MTAVPIDQGRPIPRDAYDPQPRLWSSGDMDVSVVVPYYNPGNRLRPHVEALLRAMTTTGVSFEVIAISDGSTDGSEESLDDLPRDKLRHVRLGIHQGKGGALRVGLAMGRGRYLGFIDGDGDLPASLLVDFVKLARTELPDIVIGSKRHHLSEVDYPRMRRLYSWGYQQIARVLFGLPLTDTQTGVKLVRREVLADVLWRMVENGYAFDLELLVLARRLGYRNVMEMPVVIGERFTSTVSLGTVKEMAVDTLAIFCRLHCRRAYRLPLHFE